MSERGPDDYLVVWVLSGPSLDRLGQREPSIYGTTTLRQIHDALEVDAARLGAKIVCAQTNHEGGLIDLVWKARDAGADGLLINAGGYTHTSVALLDAVRGAGLPTVEVHLTNPQAREEVRHASLVGRASLACVAGFGAASYRLALEGLLEHLRTRGGA